MRLLVGTFLALAAAAAAIIPRPTPAATTDRLADAVERYGDEDRDYWRRVDAYLAARAEGRSLTPDEQRRYSNAYVYYGYALYRQGDANGAARRFRQAITVDRTNPLAFYCLGLLQRRFDGLKPAIENLRTASRLGGPLKTPARTELTAIVRSLREQAEVLIERGSYTGAARCYEFLAANFNGTVKAHALERLKAAEDEVSAEKLLVEARREIARGRQTDGRRLLKQLLTTYAWTRAAETAKKIYRGADTLDVKVKTNSPAGKYAARERWIDLETANCIVYYKNTDFAKIAAKRIEDTLARVTDQLQYTGLDWHKDKCKVFIFDDANAWVEFVEESGATTEWAAGFAYGPLREVYMHAGSADDMLNRILPHELTHVIHREYARDDAYLPLWLLEGLACYNEFAGKDHREAIAKGALASGHLIPLGRLTASRGYPHGADISLFYAESLMLVEFIIDRFGHDGLVTLHKKLRKEYEFHKLVKRAFKMDMEEFERHWLDYIRTKE